MAPGESDTTTRQRRQPGGIGDCPRHSRRVGGSGRREPPAPGPGVGHRCHESAWKALAELGRNSEALEAYEQALERDATNRIAQRNVERLRLLLAAEKPGNGDGRAEKAPATLFIEEMGKTGRARLINLAAPRILAPLARRCRDARGQCR